MGRFETVCLILFVVLCYFRAQGADKYSDENRPYEFGFSIAGEQHRHEKKDENGIIMGEFGFITADGVYHVTVYATDENGNFKIISMKNIRVKPYPTGPDTRSPTERKGHSLPLPASQQLSSQTSTKVQSTKQDSGASLKSCSHCKVPTTTTTTSRPKLVSSSVQSTYENNKYNRPPQIGQGIQSVGVSQENSQNYNIQQVQSQYQQPAQSSQQNYQQESITRQSQKNIPNLDHSYPRQGNDFINQEQHSHNEPSQQNYQDDFNVGREYLQKTRGPQRSSAGPNSVEQSNGVYDYQQKLNVERQQEQGIIDGQYNLQLPHENENKQKISTSSGYLQGGGNIQNSVQQGQNYPSSDAKQNFIIKGNQYGQNEIDHNEPTNPSETGNYPVQPITVADREPKTFTDILQSVNPEDQAKAIGASSKSYTASQENTRKPVLVAAQMQVVDKNTNVYQTNPGENKGLPKGLTQGDMTDLLYTFNYTVGFHAHHEEGYISGAKVGYYYVTGRNGIRTRVDYVADETGFHPRISQEVFDIQSEDVPKPETEKDEKYGLKGYEFKWLYYPVETK